MANTYITRPSARIRFICLDSRAPACTGNTEGAGLTICGPCSEYRLQHGKPRHTKSDAVPPTKRVKMINPCIDCTTREASAPARVCEPCQMIRMQHQIDNYEQGKRQMRESRRAARPSATQHSTSAATTTETGSVVRSSRKWTQTAGLSKDEARKLRRQLRKESRGG